MLQQVDDTVDGFLRAVFESDDDRLVHNLVMEVWNIQVDNTSFSFLEVARRKVLLEKYTRKLLTSLSR